MELVVVWDRVELVVVLDRPWEVLVLWAYSKVVASSSLTGRSRNSLTNQHCVDTQTPFWQNVESQSSINYLNWKRKTTSIFLRHGNFVALMFIHKNYCHLVKQKRKWRRYQKRWLTIDWIYWPMDSLTLSHVICRSSKSPPPCASNLNPSQLHRSQADFYRPGLQWFLHLSSSFAYLFVLISCIIIHVVFKNLTHLVR